MKKEDYRIIEFDFETKVAVIRSGDLLLALDISAPYADQAFENFAADDALESGIQVYDCCRLADIPGSVLNPPKGFHAVTAEDGRTKFVANVIQPLRPEDN